MRGDMARYGGADLDFADAAIPAVPLAARLLAACQAHRTRGAGEFSARPWT
jgi:hypothetical protein